MTGFVDTHAHLLPGIDDGPAELAESLAMAHAAAQSGTAAIATTPHLRADFPHVHVHEIGERCARLREAIDREQIRLRVVTGAEVSLTWALEASDADLKLASFDQRGTDLLIETPTLGATGLDRLLYELRLRGYRILLAHPERSREFQQDPDRLAALVGQGVLLQLNADSLLASPRRSRGARLAQSLCTEGLAHAIASDGHRAASWRPITRLAQAAEAAADLIGAERAAWMTSAVPRAILEGAELPITPPAVSRPRQWLGFGRRT